MIYLATPYSHPDPEVRLARFHAVNRHAAKLMREGLVVYSPISATHSIAEDGELPKGWDFWEKQDEWFVKRADLLVVLKLPGWEDSVGVRAEIAIAAKNGVPVSYAEPELCCAELGEILLTP